MNASNMCSVFWLLLLWHIFCLNRINLFLSGQFVNCAVWLTRLRTCHQWQANFLEIVNFSKTHFSSCRCNFAINFFRDNRDLPNIVRGIWEDMARSRPLRLGARHWAGGGGRQEKQLPVCQPGIQNWHWPSHNTILHRISHFTIIFTQRSR